MDEETTMDEGAVVKISPQIIQTNLDTALGYLEHTTSSYSAMEKKYGPDWATKWPKTSNWYKALNGFQQVRSQILTCTFSEYGVSAFSK